jgi:hypothetical protein
MAWTASLCLSIFFPLDETTLVRTFDTQHQCLRRHDFAFLFFSFSFVWSYSSFLQVSFVSLDFWACDITARSSLARIGNKPKSGAIFLFVFSYFVLSHRFLVNAYKSRFVYRDQIKDQSQSTVYQECPHFVPFQIILMLHPVQYDRSIKASLGRITKGSYSSPDTYYPL